MRQARWFALVPALALFVAACGPSPSPEAGRQLTPDASPTVAGATGSPRAAGSPAVEVVRSIEGPHTYEAGEAGTVTFTVGAGGRLRLDSVTAKDGWSHRDESERGEIELKFDGPGGNEVEFEVKVERGRLEVEIKTERPAVNETFTVTLPHGAGTVRLSVSGRQVILDQLSAAAGWRIAKEDRSDGEVEIELLNAATSTKVELEAEVEEGELEVEVEVRLGPGFDRS